MFILFVGVFTFIFSLPNHLFQEPYCFVLEDKNGHLLGAKIATDGQWRFPQRPDIPEKFAICITQFEDKRFYYHFGVDPMSLGRALYQNITKGQVVSGASTLTMQVIRLSKHNPPRTIFEKLKELFLAIRLECSYSKKSILGLYAAHAPFGGNVVGLEAASWRYFGKSPMLLSWGEAAALAVLPNNPSLVHPGRNKDILLKKRNGLLDKLLKNKLLDEYSCQLAKEEPLPAEPLPLPKLAPHLLERFAKGNQHLTKSTIDATLQHRVDEVLSRHHEVLKGNGIHNGAVFVMEVQTGNVLAYIGNVSNCGFEHSEDVDIIQAPRSTGSTLKPFLAALMFDEGSIAPTSLIPDIPTHIYGFEPENYHETYDGVVTVRQAITRSLNVPFVRLLQQYGVEKFHLKLKKMGMKTLLHPANHYGLTLILGGAEGRLEEITNMYACMARTLQHYNTSDNRYNKHDFRPPVYSTSSDILFSNDNKREPPIFGAGGIWLALDAMTKIERPDNQGNWELFRGSKLISWKTGTSFGNRDAWAIGVTPQYAVGVWVGNADGEGRPKIVGVEAAAPILFDVFDLLPSGNWFETPYNDLIQLPLCKNSGYRVMEGCPTDSQWVSKNTIRLNPCPYHQLIYLDSTYSYQVADKCVLPSEMRTAYWFVLPPVEEYFHRAKNPTYRPLPSFRQGCEPNTSNQDAPIQLIYPKGEVKIYVPKELDGKNGQTIFKAAHRRPETPVYWHIDDQYIGTTVTFHEIAVRPPVGIHTLTLVDPVGNRISQKFEIIAK